MTDKPTNARMLTIAEALGAYYRERAGLSLREHQLDQDAEARRVYMTPVEGWPGKNAEQRDTARLAAELQDETLQKIAAELAEIKADASRDDAIVASLEAERRALEWQIRARLVDALSANRIQTDGDAKVEYAAFDAVIDAKTIHHVETQIYEPYLNGKVWPAIDAESLRQAEAAIAEVDEEMSAEADEEQAELDALRDKLAAQQALFDDDLPF